MANVKITELVELAAVDIASTDVLPIVDVSANSTKKVTIVSLRNYADANDYATYTVLVGSIANTNAYITTNYSTLVQLNTVQSNVTTLTTSVNTILSNVNSVQSNVGTLTTSVNTIKANVNSVQSNVANITNGTTAFTGVTTTFNRNVVVSGNVTIGTNTSNTLIIVGSIDLGVLT